ncbi:MAG: response regulator transcription factor, partial [Flavobacteriaceae bacterium]|nr:response regulator transcription factor [Flavobacteriaceae bacterium]
NLIATFENGLEAVNDSVIDSAQIIFLDIQMKKLNGLEFLEVTNTKAKVIIVSAYREYALDGYQYDVSGYLLKPFSFQQFLKTVLKVQSEALEEITDEKPYIFIKSGTQYKKITKSDILYVKGMADYLTLYTTSEKILTLMSFKDILSLLNSSDFIRVHKSFVVSIPHIDTISSDSLLIHTEEITISKTYKKAFFDRVKN